MSETAEITIIRTSQFTNSARRYDIFVNNQYKEKIADDEEKSMVVAPGKQKVHLQFGRAKSKAIELDLSPQEKVRLLCGSKLTGAKAWLALFYMFSTDKLIFLVTYPEETGAPVKTEETWKEIKEKGIKYFILRYGILGWGLPTGLILSILLSLINIFGDTDISIGEISINMLMSIGIFMLLGIPYGFLMWSETNKHIDE